MTSAVWSRHMSVRAVQTFCYPQYGAGSITEKYSAIPTNVPYIRVRKYIFIN